MKFLQHIEFNAKTQRRKDANSAKHLCAFAPLRLCVKIFCLVFLFATGCRTAKPLPQFNLSEPGWKVRNGQAVWHVPQGKTEVAGDLVLATGNQGQSFVQFSKSPFPLVIASATPKQWHVEFPPQNKNYSGHGAPPKRLIWLWLPRILAGEPPPKNWIWHSDESGFRLENPSNDESVEGFFNQ